nr:CehA/McbA family metallohydrolase [Candidatus Sigynarchaeota archaeon]
MNFSWLAFFCLGLFVYLFFSYLFAVLVNFKYHDGYNSEDVNYPRSRPDWVPADAFLIDMHAHTMASDGLLTPRQLIQWEIANGYDGVVVSDHNTTKGVLACQEAAAEIAPWFVVIPGTEYTSLNIHLNLIGVRTPFPSPNLVWTTRKTLQKVIDHAHREGGVVQFNHKSWYFYDVLKKFPRQWLADQGIDGWEVYNGFGFIDEEALEFIQQQRDRKIMFAGAGTDVHDPAKHHRMYTAVLSNERSVEGVMKALKEGKTMVYYDPAKPMPRPEKGKLILNPDKSAFIKRWAWLGWAGLTLMWGTHRRLLIAFVVTVVALGVLMSLF